MRQHFLSTTLLIGGALLTVGCQSAIEPTDLSTAQLIAPEATIARSPNEAGTEIANSQPATATEQAALPAIATLTRIEPGDLQCYLSFTDSQNQRFDIGGSFDICTEQYLNQSVQITYEAGTVNDCESIEPCGQTQDVILVTQLQSTAAPSSDQTPPSDGTTYRNPNWTVSVSNSKSWSGINGTGDFHYRGCDRAGNCLELTGGTATCRNGQCLTSWQNGKFSYTLISQLTEDLGDGTVQLVVREDRTILVDEQLQVQ